MLEYQGKAVDKDIVSKKRGYLLYDLEKKTIFYMNEIKYGM